MTKETFVIKVLTKNGFGGMPKDRMDILAGKIVGALDLFEDLFGPGPSLLEPISICEPTAAISRDEIEPVMDKVVEIRKTKKKQEPEAPKQFLDEPRDIDEMFEEFQQEFPTVMELKVFPTKPAIEVCCYVGKLLDSQTYLNKDGKGKSGVTLRIVKKYPGREDVVLLPDRFIFSEENLSAKDIKEESTRLIREQLQRVNKEIPVRVLPPPQSVPDNLDQWGGGNAV